MGGPDLFADTPGELQTAGIRLGASHRQRLAAGTPADRIVELTQRQRRTLQATEDVTVLTLTEVNLLVDARRLQVPFDLRQVRLDAAAFADRLVDAARTQPRPNTPTRIRTPRGELHVLVGATVNVSTPTRWANPYPVASRSPAGHASAVAHFRCYLERNPLLAEQGSMQLRGLNLACTCSLDVACHADIWLEFANHDA
ncbi:DUF4326 domain-containing protein [Tessaracoccus sp. Z1128]